MDGSPVSVAKGNNVRCRSEPRFDPMEGLEPETLNIANAIAHISAPAPSCTLSGEIRAIPISTPLVNSVTSHVHSVRLILFPN
ncbi:hypothetical protein Nepgr_015831 [Nepenthes gracilis]|uniref:Uncharacterized protein n=1 Tax=Nepenthes gracilis TaxID=150966 RepID=A0AAD3SNJ7_NEPGR|nr:hypothetical protein Nepgr_015831 [Nepenthes gracilis]